ncbi:DUF2254 domain-containing protein [Hymenobacter sp. 15J16-1T3B]|uniref:DUF2254 domain-containing protein n=1 Tax=Hymenobacter sp. 15J16-1T3B TaxID=2886941 RepID=UPI001D11639B|nr:DUF2254 domain-containing protein [Hymenobacter sp. 15J16-1T3B]MCC3159753.1 DUF2254 domain-containing protein [Hymenobacter sp. 15J16-1T3B]
MRFRPLWQRLRESLWFVPGLLVLGAFGLAYALIAFDTRTSFDGAKRFPLLFGAGAEGSRGMLTAIAGSMLTVAALVFSLTLSTISQVSSQYSPRVLRNFMRDRGNQVVMGYFVGVFAYCLIVLGTIRSADEQKFVPSTAVLVGLVLALGGVAALIYFIHHIAESLQTGTILHRISRETTRALDVLFPEELGEPAEPLTAPAPAAGPGQPVCAARTGYVQQIDAEALLRWAAEHRVFVRLEQPVGAFVGEQDRLARLQPDEHSASPLSASDLAGLRACVVIELHRSIEQDVAFGLQQLVDIALKALSPGINDTTTAIMAVDHLGRLMQRLAGRTFPARLRADNRQQPRVLVPAPDFDAYLRLAFDLVRINAKGNHALLRRLLRALARTAEAANTAERRRAVARQAELLRELAEQNLSTDYEKQSVRALLAELSPSWEPTPTA